MAKDESLFVLGMAWSQTDHENVLVSARCVSDAQDKVNKMFPGIHHITGCRLINHMIIGERHGR